MQEQQIYEYVFMVQGCVYTFQHINTDSDISILLLFQIANLPWVTSLIQRTFYNT